MVAEESYNHSRLANTIELANIYMELDVISRVYLTLLLHYSYS